MQLLIKTMDKIVFALFVLAFVFMLLQPFTDTGFVEPISVVILTLFLFILFRFLYRKFQKLSQKRLKIVIFAFFVLFIVLQILSVTLVRIQLFGDPWHSLLQATRIVQGSHYWDEWILYYPNLLPMIALETVFIKLAGLLNVSYYVIFYAFNIFINTMIWVVMARFLWKQKPYLAAFASFLMLIIPMNYDFMLRVGYTDGVSILGLLLLVFAFDKLKHEKKLSWKQALGVVLIFTISYLARPNVIVFMVALFILGLISFYRRKKSGNLWKAISKMFLACAVGIVLAMGATRGIAGALDYNLNNPSAFPTANWIYESLNYESFGEWTHTDRDYTANHAGFDTAKEADMAGIKSRLVSLGTHPWRIPVLILVKFATLWSCGTFATGTDYQLFSQIYNWANAPGFVVQNIGSINLFMATYAKALVGLFLFAIVIRLWKTKREWVSLFGLSLLSIMGISLFHTLIWEVKPRYQFMTFGLLVIIALLSFENIFDEKVTDRSVSSFFERWKNKLKFLVPVFACISLVLMGTVMQLQPKQNVVVVAQNQTLDNYTLSNDRLSLGAQERITQEVNLPTSAGKFSLQTNATKNLKIMIDKKSGSQWQRVFTGTILSNELEFDAKMNLAAGHYRIELFNPNEQAVQVDTMLNPQNLDFPYLAQLSDHQTGSLRFSFSQIQARSKFPLGLILIFALLFLLTELSVIFL